MLNCFQMHENTSISIKSPVFLWYRKHFKIHGIWKLGDFRLASNTFLNEFTNEVFLGPFICSRYTTPAKCSSNKFSVHERSDCEHWNVLGTPSFRFKIGTSSRSAQYDLLCIHCATCEVILTCTLRADSGLRAKPCQVRTCSQFHIVQTSFQRRTKGASCSENTVRFRTRSDYKKWCVPRTCSSSKSTENICERPVCRLKSLSVYPALLV